MASRKQTALEIGVASIDITPPVGVRLAGYGPRKGAPSTGLGHRLRAEALVCRGADGGTWALLTSDTVGYPHDLVQRVRQQAAARTDLKPQAILVSATHTHSGPAAMRTYSGDLTEMEEAYRRDLESRLAEVIVQARQRAAPGSFQAARAEAPDLAHNRRAVQPDGKVLNEWEDPDGRHVGYYDPAVVLVAARRPDGRRDALIVNYGCHPVVLGPRSMDISADYVGYLKDALEAQNPGMTVLFALGGGGNINPRVCIQVGAEYPQRMGQRLAEIVQAAMPKLRAVSGGPVRSAQQAWSFPAERDWPEGSGRKKGQPLATEIMALRAGKLGAVGLPGELFSEYAAMLRKASPLKPTLVVSIANDSTGYLPVDAALPLGGHEVTHRAAAEGIEKSLLATAGQALAAAAG